MVGQFLKFSLTVVKKKPLEIHCKKKVNFCSEYLRFYELVLLKANFTFIFYWMGELGGIVGVSGEIRREQKD